jgi:hypothetical protein
MKPNRKYDDSQRRAVRSSGRFSADGGSGNPGTAFTNKTSSTAAAATAVRPLAAIPIIFPSNI